MELNKFPRPLSDGEWTFYSKSFPHLQRANVTVLGPKDQKYNCISSSLGFQDRWIDVGETKTGLANMYAHYYYVACDTATAEIDAYASGEVPKHAAKLESATICTSKMQVQSKLRHNRQELEGGAYGSIYGHFKKDASHPGNNDPKMPKPDHPNNHELPPPLPVGHPGGKSPVVPIHPPPPTTFPTHPAPAHPTQPAPAHPAPTHPAPPTHPGHLGLSKKAVSPMRPYDPVPPPADPAISSVHELHASLANSNAPGVDNFENLYAAWKATWHAPGMELEPNSSARAKGPEFDTLVRLGPAIIPLVVKKLTGPDEFFAVQLYNALEKDEGVKVDPTNVLDHNVLQRHASLIVDMNHQRNVAFATKAAQWQEHQDEHSLSANSTDYTSGDAYKSMVQMGPSVIGHVMDKYNNEPDGWWHEMLHEIVHGKPSGDRTFFKDKLYADWKKWFESGQPHDAAPKSG